MTSFDKPDKVLLLTIDALRYDVIEGDEVETPNMKRIKEKGWDFKRAFANGRSTHQVFPGILYSSEDNEAGEAPNRKSLSKCFQELDFHTIGITSNPYTSSYFGYDKGFDVFEDFVKPTKEKEESSTLFKLARGFVTKFDFLYEYITSFNAKHSLPYERAETINKEVLASIEEGERQFIWTHYMDPHAPYSPVKEYGEKYCPEEYKERGRLTNVFQSDEISDEDGEKMRQLYLTEVKYLDDKIGELLDELEKLDEEILIVFTSDHGEAFGERGCYKHRDFFEFNIHVPLTFYQIGRDQGEEEKIASHLDILPTLMDLYGKNVLTEGINLFEEKRDNLTIEVNDNFVAITEEWKLIETKEGCCYLFNIVDSLDEEENVYDAEREVLDNLQKLREDRVEKGIDM